LDTTWVKLHGTSSPPTLRVKCRVLKIGKCTWSGCHVVASLEVQVDWVSVGVMYIWKSTQVTNNHVREFRSMPFPSRALRSNLVTLVWLVVPAWNPIVSCRMHGLMHDGWLQACPSYLLGLLYGCKVMNILKWLCAIRFRVSAFGGCIKGPSPSLIL